MASWRKGKSRKILKHEKDWDWYSQKVQGDNIVKGNKYNEPKTNEEFYLFGTHFTHIGGKYPI